MVFNLQNSDQPMSSKSYGLYMRFVDKKDKLVNTIVLGQRGAAASERTHTHKKQTYSDVA